MEREEAISILATVCSQAALPVAGHQKWQEAIKVLREESKEEDDGGE